MKKNYNIPEIDVISIEDIDVRTASVVGDDIVVDADNIF